MFHIYHKFNKIPTLMGVIVNTTRYHCAALQ